MSGASADSSASMSIDVPASTAPTGATNNEGLKVTLKRKANALEGAPAAAASAAEPVGAAASSTGATGAVVQAQDAASDPKRVKLEAPNALVPAPANATQAVGNCVRCKSLILMA